MTGLFFIITCSIFTINNNIVSSQLTTTIEPESGIIICIIRNDTAHNPNILITVSEIV